MSPALRPIQIFPSILSADFAQLGAEVDAIMAAGADGVHVDVMDGHFVPNISFGAAVMRSVRPRTPALFDVHLMIAPVEPYLADFAEAGADRLTAHAEAGAHLHRILAMTRGLGKRCGVAINPGTPAQAIVPVLDDIDLVLVMTVDPGFGGQSFLRSQLEKIRLVRELCAGRAIDIEADGGVGPENAAAAAAAGANVFVAGSSVFKGGPSTYARNIHAIRQAAASARGEII